jgi:hypothetical protein
VVLVTLEGCQLLAGLVVVSVEAHKEDCACSEEEIVRGTVLTPMGAAKSNSS